MKSTRAQGRKSTSTGKSKTAGFTLIEVIVTVTIIAIMMIPAAMIVMECVRSAAYADSITQASNLARREIGIVNNLAYTDATLASGYNNLTSSYAGYNYDLRRQVSSVTDASGSTANLKKVAITVYPHGSSTKLTEADTYVINGVTSGAGSGGGTRSGTEAAALSITGGGFQDPKLINVGIRNTRTTGNITIIGMYMWQTSGSKKLTVAVLSGNQTVYSGNLTLPNSKPASPNVIFQAANIVNYSAVADTTANFTFNNAIGNNRWVYIIFVMSDGSQTGTYSWKR